MKHSHNLKDMVSWIDRDREEYRIWLSEQQKKEKEALEALMQSVRYRQVHIIFVTPNMEAMLRSPFPPSPKGKGIHGGSL